jgi:D-alanyl-D-alanine carboxypeptidase (penicillin-binding protein 5/6)
MNRFSKQIEMFNSNFANVHGLSNVYSFSTANDVAKLCSFAMKNSIFRKIVQTEIYNYTFYSKNEEILNDS